MVRLKFLGAAQCVTGSKYVLEANGKRILIDCGMFAGRKELRLRNRAPFPIQPSMIDMVLITHAHIDHTGYLPRLVKDGFSGKIFCTLATEELIKIELLDAAKLQEEEALFALKKGYSKHEKPEPLFTTQDAKAVFTLVESYPWEKWIDLTENLKFCFQRASHILGAAHIELDIIGKTQTKRIVFSGDIGRFEDPVLKPAVPPKKADILLIESTYGNRTNPMQDVEGELEKIANEALENGCLIVPAFAVGRTQSLLFYFHKLINEKRIPEVPIFVDSPMAINVTSLYEKFPDELTIRVTGNGNSLHSIFDAPFIHFIQSSDDSKALNNRKKPCIIISASGMITGGRILHHLYHRLRRPEDTLLFAGYQAEGSRGRSILEGDPTVRIFGEEVPVKCQVRELHGLSAHADQPELLRWVSQIKDSPKMTYITHGELESATAFAQVLNQKLGWNVSVPNYLDTAVLFDGI